ncbi:hypothetical protein [Streptomyces sp. NPDC050560]|uniref:hypothetical protein n=1 Tax=Streptomyces sp. NPDC050560 TaxID=3365630 RepID=UPI0037B81F7D
MNTEIATALVGLGGAVIGAAASVAATWLTLRHQSQEAKNARLYEIGRLAAEEALSELIQLQQFLETVSLPIGPAVRHPWEDSAMGHLRRSVLAMARIPGEAIVPRVQLSYDLARAYRYGGPRHFLRVRWMRWAVEDLIAVMLEYIRQAELPDPTPQVRACKDTYDRKRRREAEEYELQEPDDYESEPDDAP